MSEDRRKRLQKLAGIAAEFFEPLRRRTVADLIHERFRQEIEAAFRGDLPDVPCTAEEIILAAYPTTNHYWRAWLYGPLPREELIARLAEATASSEGDLQRRCQLLREALAACPFDVEADAATVAAGWLADHPDLVGLLHCSLLAYLAKPEGATASPFPPEPRAPSKAPPSPLEVPADLQARYDARVTAARAPTWPEDRAWAKTHGILHKQLEEVRRNNPDPRLHTWRRR